MIESEATSSVQNHDNRDVLDCVTCAIRQSYACFGPLQDGSIRLRNSDAHVRRSAGRIL